MASKNLMYKVSGKPNKEIVEKLNENEHIFFRFQEPHQKLTSRSESWGMIYGSKREALAEGYEILPGKSCTDKLEDLSQWAVYYDNNYVVVAFEGHDTGVVGDDGECVATYYKKIAVWNYEDVANYISD